MPNMMNGATMSGSPLFWVSIGVLSFLFLLSILIWLLMQRMNTHAYAHRQPATHSQASYEGYEQGYQTPAETYQEDSPYYTPTQSPYEQPSTHYPQEMPPQ